MMPSDIAATPDRSIENVSFAPFATAGGHVLGLTDEPVAAGRARR